MTTKLNIANFKRQLKSLGFSYDWERELATTDVGYVKWTQWIFLQLFKQVRATIKRLYNSPSRPSPHAPSLLSSACALRGCAGLRVVSTTRRLNNPPHWALQSPAFQYEKAVSWCLNRKHLNNNRL